jgi:hypothetical protein
MFEHLHVFQEAIGEGKQGQETNRKGCYTNVWVASLARDDLVNDLFDSIMVRSDSAFDEWWWGG